MATPQEVQDAIADDGVLEVGKIELQIARFPYGFIAERIWDKDGNQVVIPKDSDQYRRLQIRKKQRGVTYIRAGREIDFVDNMPRTESERADGLGKWPAQQAYSMHYGLQLSFAPVLDEAFGIGNDKQTVNPIEDLWRVLAEPRSTTKTGLCRQGMRRQMSIDRQGLPLACTEHKGHRHPVENSIATVDGPMVIRAHENEIFRHVLPAATQPNDMMHFTQRFPIFIARVPHT